jgi:hypothetical protein
MKRDARTALSSLSAGPEAQSHEDPCLPAGRHRPTKMELTRQSSQRSRTQVKLVRMAARLRKYNEARSCTDHLKAQGCSMTQRMSQLEQGPWSPALPRTGAVPGQTKATDTSSPHP